VATRSTQRTTAAAAMLALFAGCGGGNTYVEPKPPEVTVGSPIRREVISYNEYTGTAQPILTVEIRARVRGFLKERLYTEGAAVKAGDLLLVIDEEPFKLNLNQARTRQAEADAALRKAKESKAREIAQAQVALDESQLLLARIDETRERNLLNRNAASREELDRAEANRKKNEAQVQSALANQAQAKADYDINILSADAGVAAARSAVRNAEIDLSYCRMTAPIDGRIGRASVDVGNLVGDAAQSSLLATIVKIDPIYAYMSVSEADVLTYRAKQRALRAAGEAEGEADEVDLALADEVGYPHRGKIDYVDPGVDPGTGTIRLRAIFPNADRAILPGLFVRVRVPTGTDPAALLVPERALGSDQSGQYLLVVGKDDLVEQRPVKVGTLQGDLRVVSGKIDLNDRIVVDGLLRARPGQKVTPKPIAPAVASAAGGGGGPAGTSDGDATSH